MLARMLREGGLAATLPLAQRSALTAAATAFEGAIRLAHLLEIAKQESQVHCMQLLKGAN